MHSNSLAPVLSATRSRDSCWITTDSSIVPLCAGNSLFKAGGLLPLLQAEGLLRLLENLDHAPPLRGGRRPGLHEQHPVADAAGVLLVVRLHPAGTPHDLG